MFCHKQFVMGGSFRLEASSRTITSCFWPKVDFGRSASRPRLRALVCHAPLELHYCERSAQGLVGYLNRTMKWLVHVQYKVNGSRNE